MAVTTTSYGRDRGVGGWRRGDAVALTTVTWESDGSGDATETITGFDGRLFRVVTVPDGTAAPTDDYDVTIVDDDGLDILNGAGANRDTANAEEIAATGAPCVHYGDLVVTVANAGASKQGTVKLYWST